MYAAVLGPLAVSLDGTPVPLRSAMSRRLVARLLLGPDSAVPAERLADAVWPQGPPPTYRHSLANQVMRLRHHLGSDSIVSAPGAYGLASSGWAVDVTDFEALSTSARRAFDGGDPVSALQSASRALCLWRGRPFPDLDDDVDAAASVIRLCHLERSAREVRVESMVRLGRADEVLACADELTEDDPYAEKGWYLRALTRASAQRRREALLVLAEARRELGNVGISLSEQVDELERTLLDGADVTELLGRYGGQPRDRARCTRRFGRDTTFVGRYDELRQLDDALAAARRGQASHCATGLVTGPGGIGKTRLLDEFVRCCLEPSDVVLHFDPRESSPSPVAAVVDAMRELLGSSPPAALRGLSVSEETARVVPGLHDVVAVTAMAETAYETRRHRFACEVSSIVTRITGARRLVVVIDDVQWSSIEMLDVVQRIIDDGLPTLLLVARREPWPCPAHVVAFLARLHQGRATEIELAGLSERAISDYLHQRFGTPDEHLDVARRLLHTTEGNPFFLTEVTETAFAAGELRAGPTGWSLAEALDVPSRVRSVFDLRLAALRPGTRRMIDALAVLGEPCPLGVLSDIAPGAAAGLADAEELGIVRVWRPARRSETLVRFRHDLIRQHARSVLSDASSVELADRLATGLEAAGDDSTGHARWLQQIASLRLICCELDPAMAVESARRAAAGALGEFSVQRAADLLAAARRIAGEHGVADEVLELDLAIEEGDLRRRIGDPAHRQLLQLAAERAERIGELDHMARAALAFCRVGAASEVGIFDEEAAALAERVLARMPITPSTTRAQLLGAASHLHSNSLARHRGRGLYSEAEGMARALGDESVLAEVLAYAYWMESGPDTLDELDARGHELIRLGATTGPRAVWEGNRIVFSVALQRNRASEALAAHATMSGLLDATGDQIDVAVVEYQEAILAAIRGDHDAVSGACTRCYEASVRCGLAPSRMEAVIGAQWLMSAWLAGTVADLAPVLVELADAQEGIPAWQMAVAFAQVCAGDLDDARRRLDQLARSGSDPFPKDYVWSVAAVGQALTAGAGGFVDHARVAYDRLAPYSGRLSWGGAITLGLVDQALGDAAGAFGALDTARGHYERALEQARLWSSPVFEAHAHAGLAEVSLAGRDDAGSRRHFERAEEISTEYGLGGVLRRTRELSARVR